MKIGLRIDVDTYRGTRLGVPALCRMLAAHGARGSFFFSLGPDNMGRNLWRLLRPRFALKMLRTRAASLYGWDILLRGTFWPGPLIGKALGGTIKIAACEGHETGLHAWDHHYWQTALERMDDSALRRQLRLGFELLSQIEGRPCGCSAAPAWRCDERVLAAKLAFPFRYNSDCRGSTIFRPLLGGGREGQLQVPVTLPTYDELIGQHGVSDVNYNQRLLELLDADRLNVLTIHAEVEGIAKQGLFADFLRAASARGWSFVPLGELIEPGKEYQRCALRSAPIAGREGVVALQETP